MRGFSHESQANESKVSIHAPARGATEIVEWYQSEGDETKTIYVDAMKDLPDVLTGEPNLGKKGGT